jgi:ABC-type lipoprotein release transport system permease subunit
MNAIWAALALIAVCVGLMVYVVVTANMNGGDEEDKSEENR